MRVSLVNADDLIRQLATTNSVSAAIEREAARVRDDFARRRPATLESLLREAGQMDRALLPERTTRWRPANIGVSAESAGRALQGALTGRANRRVVEHPAGWAVTDSNFVTIDQTLARCVADEYDRIDPLPSYKYGGPVRGPGTPT